MRTFLGKLGMWFPGHGSLAVSRGRCDLLDVGSSPGDGGVFLAYDYGDGTCRLQADDGLWLALRSATPRNDDYPRLLAVATVSPDTAATGFDLEQFRSRGSVMRLSWVNDDGARVCVRPRGLPNPLCGVRLDVAREQDAGLDELVGTRFIAPGVAVVRENRSCAGADFGPVGSAHVDLSGADLSGVDASRAVFDGADLRSTDLRGTDLTDASLLGAQVGGTDLRDLDADRPTTLAGTDLSGLDLTPVLFPARHPLCTEPGNPVRFVGSTVPFATLTDGTTSDWSNLDLTAATVTGLPRNAAGRLVLDRLRAENTVLRGWRMPGASLRHAHFAGADLAGVNLSGADLTAADFSKASLVKAGDYPEAADLYGAELFDATFADAQLTGVSFAAARLWGSASVSGATMPLTRFTGAFLEKLDFSKVEGLNLQDADFTDACLVNCTFDGATVTPAQGARTSFAGASMEGATFRDARLYGADLSEAAVATEAGTFWATLPVQGTPTRISFPYGPTVLGPEVTTADTICPDGSNGPCCGSKLIAPHPPTTWPPTSRS